MKYNDNTPTYTMIMHMFTAQHICFTFHVAGIIELQKDISSLPCYSGVVIDSKERNGNTRFEFSEENKQC